jgi:hypothetical protein
MKIRVHYQINYLDNHGVLIIEGEPQVVEIGLGDTIEITPERPTIWLGRLDITDAVFAGIEPQAFPPEPHERT